MRRSLLRFWWAWIVLAAVVVQLAHGHGTFTGWETAFQDAASRRAPAPDWPDELVVVLIAQEDLAEWNASRTAALARRLRELGARTVAPFVALTPGDPGLPELEVIAERLVLPAFPAPGAELPAAAVMDAVLLERGALTTLPRPTLLQAFWLPPAPLAERAAVGHAAISLDVDNVVRRDLPLLPVVEGDRLFPSFAVAAFARHHGLDLHEIPTAPASFDLGQKRVRVGADGVLLDLRGPNPPRTLSAGTILDPEGGDALLRAQVEDRLAFVIPELGELDQILLPGPRLAPAGLAAAYAYRTYVTGRPVRVPAVTLIGPLVLVSLLVARLRPKGSPAAVAAVAAGVALLTGAVCWLSFTLFGIVVPFVPALVYLFIAAIVFGLLSTAGVQGRLERAEARADAAVAPTGRIALVFTDVQGSTRLWEKLPTVMREALALHNALFRRFLEEAGGYEVKTEGDAFMLAFADPLDALRWCLDVQRTLVSLPWPAELAAQPDAAEERDEAGIVYFRGLRVRMGIHVGDPEPVPDPKSGRMDYFGPPVNRAARVSGAAHGGQILVSGDAWRALEPRLPQAPLHRTRAMGEHRLKGLDAPERLVEVVPEAFRARTFPPPKTETTKPGVSAG